MAPDVATALAQLGRRLDWVGDDDLVFVGEVGGYLDGSALRRRYKDALGRASLRPLRFHDLRHTFGTRMIAKADIGRVQEWMGHADIQTTCGTCTTRHGARTRRWWRRRSAWSRRRRRRQKCPNDRSVPKRPRDAPANRHVGARRPRLVSVGPVPLLPRALAPVIPCAEGGSQHAAHRRRRRHEGAHGAGRSGTIRGQHPERATKTAGNLARKLCANRGWR